MKFPTLKTRRACRIAGGISSFKACPRARDTHLGSKVKHELLLWTNRCDCERRDRDISRALAVSIVWVLSEMARSSQNQRPLIHASPPTVSSTGLPVRGHLEIRPLVSARTAPVSISTINQSRHRQISGLQAAMFRSTGVLSSTRQSLDKQDWHADKRSL